MPLYKKRLKHDLEDQDCYAICTSVSPTDNSLERRVSLGEPKDTFIVNIRQLALTKSGLVATEVGFDNVKKRIARVCPYAAPTPSARYVPLNLIVKAEDTIKYDGRLQ